MPEITSNTRFGLSPHVVQAIQECLATTAPVEEAILYGSRAKGNYQNGSDIDITLRGKNLTLHDLFQLENDLDDLLLPYQIDLSIHYHLDNQALLDHIKRVGICFYQKGETKVFK